MLILLNQYFLKIFKKNIFKSNQSKEKERSNVDNNIYMN